jgi:hypothetical protein
MTTHEMPFISNEILRLTQSGIWLANGSEITHQSTVEAFFRNIHRDEQGYLIRIGKESKRIEVEDTAYFVTGLEGSAAKGFLITLSDQSQEKLVPSALSYRPGRLSVAIERRGQKEEARFLHAPYFSLLGGR